MTYDRFRETMRKFGTEAPTTESLCKDCGLNWGSHSDHYCPSNLPPPEMPRAIPTEMTSLKEIKQRLATIEQGQDKLEARIDAVAIGQGVLCERLDALTEQVKMVGCVVQNGQMQAHDQAEHNFQAINAWAEDTVKRLDAIFNAATQPGKPKAKRRQERA